MAFLLGVVCGVVLLIIVIVVLAPEATDSGPEVEVSKTLNALDDLDTLALSARRHLLQAALDELERAESRRDRSP